MIGPVLPNEYVALALIKAKFQIFNENFATTSELNQFRLFMKQEFNKRKLGIEITHELGIYFNVKGDVVTVTDSCCLDLDRLPNEILDILTNESLILEFFVKVETRRLEILKSFSKAPLSAEASTNKQLTRVKSSGKGV